jgi:hypothetical protein
MLNGVFEHKFGCNRHINLIIHRISLEMALELEINSKYRDEYNYIFHTKLLSNGSNKNQA